MFMKFCDIRKKVMNSVLAPLVAVLLNLALAYVVYFLCRVA